MVCRVFTHMGKHPAPHRLWELSAAVALRQLRRLLTLMAVPNAGAFTLKAFRAGKATALAAAGKSLDIILAAGEWRPSAFLSYVDTDVVDQAQVLDQTLAASDDEAETLEA